VIKTQLPIKNIANLYTDIETPILSFWKQQQIFEKSISLRPESNHFVFYDGPPFITGTPHYGHLLSSILKDIVPRYQTMLGKRVERVWGWDCHGLPIEEKVERGLGTKNRRDIEQKVGIQKFIDACFNYVSETSEEWPWYIDRIGRWVDMEHPYRTMDKNYMESVIWAFKQLYEKDYIYKGKRVSLYCTRCGTPISNFEVAMDNSYADLEDPSVFIKFPLKYHKTGIGVGIVIRNEKGEILMMRRNEPGREKVWGGIGGKYEESDGSIETLVNREMEEEIGIKSIKILIHGYSIDIFEGRLFKTYHVEATINQEPKQPVQEIATELKWFSVQELPWDDMHIPTKNTLKDVLQNKPRNEKFSTEKPPVYAIAWTTTPWTLPENAALAVDTNAIYTSVQVESGEIYVFAKNRTEAVLKELKVTVVDEFLGKDLAGIHYEPLFTYFETNENDHRIYPATFVSMDDGSGIVHIAPGFGEDDTELGRLHGLTMFEGVNDEGKLIEQIKDFAGLYIKDADPKIIEALEQRGLMHRSEKLTHSYPLCWRCKNPLIYKAQDSWYVDITQLKPQLETNNENINWVPEHIKTGRFLAGIKSAPDWGVSRTRYWATPMPIWECDECDHREVLGSIAEIEERSGKEVTDLHRPYIDAHTYSCKQCDKGTMKRVEEVLDCWLESASMPFAQVHYPFENKEKFDANFPGDYIVEYVPQTRAWFYVMHVISTALFGTSAFKNAICTGTIMGNDGRKMSKSYGNYPDPKIVIEKYGADAIRLFMANSVLTKAEDVDMSEELVFQQTKDTILPLFNLYKYFALYSNQHQFEPASEYISTNTLDVWIQTRVRYASLEMKKALDSYQVQDATAQIKPLIDDISTWYIRRSRDRFVTGEKDALNTLFMVLIESLKLFAPIMPFATEAIYQDLKQLLPEQDRMESLHLTDWTIVESLTDKEKRSLDEMVHVRSIASLALSIRDEKSLALKQPLAQLEIVGDLSDELLELIKQEVNVLSIAVVPGKEEFSDGLTAKENETDLVGLDIRITPELEQQGLLRELIRTVQVSRRTSGFEMGEKANATIISESNEVAILVTRFGEIIQKQGNLGSIVFKKQKPTDETKVVKIRQGQILLEVILGK